MAVDQVQHLIAGRYKQQAELAASGSRPYWQYLAIRDNRTRPSHSALHGRVWRADDPIWNSLYPPNGWNCRCRVRALSDRRLEKEGLKAENSAGQLVTREVSAGKLPDGTPDMRPVTGIKYLGLDGKDAVMLPDAGWSYNPGRRYLETDPHWDRPDCNGTAALTATTSKPCVRMVDGQKTWRDYGRPDVKNIPQELRATAPEILNAAKNRQDAETLLRNALGLVGENAAIRTIKTPIESVILNAAWIPHMVEKEDNARERFTNFILPTLQNPFEVYATD